MTVMHAVGAGHRLPPHAHLHELDDEYVVELDVSDFTERELEVEVTGTLVAVRGDQLPAEDDETRAFRLHERLEESFQLPDDVDPAGVRAFYKHGTLGIHAPRTKPGPRLVPIEHERWRLDPNAEPC
jgi:HSP20 family molecular chaperone IbpA